MQERQTSATIIPRVGAGVWTEDEERIGSVGDIVGDYMRVDDGDGRARWFELGTLQSADDERVILGFGSDDIAASEVPPPDAPNLGTALLPDEQEQRETMLRELAEQRQRMHAEGRATPEADRTVGEPVEEELAEMESDDSEPPAMR